MIDHSDPNFQAAKATSDTNIDPGNESVVVVRGSGLGSITPGNLSQPRNLQPLGESLSQSLSAACSPGPCIVIVYL